MVVSQLTVEARGNGAPPTTRVIRAGAFARTAWYRWLHQENDASRALCPAKDKEKETDDGTAFPCITPLEARLDHARVTCRCGGAGRELRGANAQDQTASHPVHIHEGTCDDLNPKPLFPLTNVSEMGLLEGMTGGTPEADDAAMETSDPMGAETAFGVETSYTLVEASLEDIVEGGHAINIHESTENVENYITCGGIGS